MNKRVFELAADSGFTADRDNERIYCMGKDITARVEKLVRKIESADGDALREAQRRIVVLQRNLNDALDFIMQNEVRLKMSGIDGAQIVAAAAELERVTQTIQTGPPNGPKAVVNIHAARKAASTSASHLRKEN